MTAAFLLDTSFLITLVDDSRRDHTVARQHYEHALQHGAQLHVSTQALAEFATKQAVTNLPLRTLRIEPFNIRHAIKSGELCAPLMPARDATDSRAVVRTDLQLIAQAASENIPFILTEDRNTLIKYVDRTRAARTCHCEAVLLADSFDAVWFDDRQRAMEQGLSDEEIACYDAPARN